MTLPPSDLDAAPQWPDLADAQFRGHPRGGYDEEEVDRYLDHLAAVVAQSERHRAAQQRELDRLRQAARGDTRNQEALAADAVELLSRAQVIADRCVADAEQYARDLVLTARTQYREVLERAERSADSTQQDLRSELPAVSAPVPELDYVRTYARVAQVQLRSVLEALAEQVDKLAVAPGGDAGVDASTSTTADNPFEPNPGSATDPATAPAVPAAPLWHGRVDPLATSFRGSAAT
jgi:DivIVA domain-containing protein